MINVHNFCKLLPLAAEFFIRKMKTRKFELMLMRGVKVYSVLTVHGLWISFLLEIELTLKKFMTKGSMGVCLRFILEIHSILHYALLANFFIFLLFQRLSPRKILTLTCPDKSEIHTHVDKRQ